MCAAYRCSRRCQECSQRTINQSRASLTTTVQQHNKLHLYKALERGTIDQRRTWEYGDRGKGVGLYRDLSSSLSCCRRRAMRHSNGAKDAPISSPIGCKVARHLRIPLHKRASVAAMERERWGDSRGHEPHESSTEETRPTIDVRGFKSARKSISSGSAPPIVWFATRRRQGLRDRQTPSSKTEQQERAASEERRGKKKKGTTRAVPEWSPTSVLNAPDEV